MKVDGRQDASRGDGFRMARGNTRSKMRRKREKVKETGLKRRMNRGTNLEDGIISLAG